MINTVYFEKGSNFANVYNLYQWDYGQSLEIKGLDIHDNVWVQFSMNASGGNAIPVVAEVNDGVITANIPAFVFEKETSQNYNAYAFVYVSNVDSGETVKVIKLNIKARPKPEDYVYTEPEKQRYENLENLIKSFLNSNGEIDPKKIPDMYYKEDGFVNTIKEEYLGLDWVPKIRVNNVEIFKEQEITVTNQNSLGNGKLYLYDLNIDQETRNRIVDEFESLTLVLDGNKIELPYVERLEEDGYVNAAIFTQGPYSVAGNNLAGSVIVGNGQNATMQVVLTLGEHTLEVRHINVTPNPLPAELLTDGTPYLEKTFSEILPEMTGTTSDLYGGQINLPKGLELFEGDEYNVKWQGKEYDCICYSVEMENVKVNILGDAYTLSGGEVGKEATGEPFCFFIYPKELQGVINASGGCTPVPPVINETFTFSIEGCKKKLRKLPEECLPDSIKELLNGSLPNIKVDSELSKTSTNPVQNKVVAEAVEKLSEEIVDQIGTVKSISGSEIEINEDGLIYITNIDISDAKDDTVISATSKNLLNEDDFLNGIWEYPAWHRDVYNLDLPNGTYTISFTPKTVEKTSGEYITLEISADNFTNISETVTFLNSDKGWTENTSTFTIEDGYKSRIKHYSYEYILKRNDLIEKVMLEKGSFATKYIPYVPPTVYLYNDIVKNNLRIPVYDSYVKITNNHNNNMNISYTVNGDIYKYINDSVKKEEGMRLYVTPQDFGAKGDGYTDDTLALREALQEAINSNIKVLIPKTPRSYVFTSLELPENAEIELFGQLSTSIDDTGISIIGSNVKIYGSGSIHYGGTKSLVKIDVSGKTLKNIRIETNLVGNEYRADTKTCVAIEITLGGSEYGYLYPSYIGGTIENFNIGLWQHAEENSNENSWSTGLRFDGVIGKCTEAIKFETSGGGSEIWGQIQPFNSNGDSANIIDKPLVTLNTYMTLGAMLWDMGEAVNRYSLYCIEKNNVILNSSWLIHYGFCKFRHPWQITMPKSGERSVPKIQGQYGYSLQDVYSTNNILLNAHNNPKITINTNLINCSISNENSIYSTTNQEMTIGKIDSLEVGICEIEYEFDELKPLRNITVLGEILPDKIDIAVYDSNYELIDSSETIKNVDFVTVNGNLSNASWRYNYEKAGSKILDANVKKVKIVMYLEETKNADVYNIAIMDGTDNFVPKTGGDVDGKLNLKGGLRLYDENGVAYDLIVDAEGKLSARLSN